MGLGDLTLLLVGRDSLAQQLHVHLEHRGADIERTEASEAVDTIRVAVPDLIVLAPDAAASDGERIRDALAAAGKPPRVLALCDKKLGAKIATFKHDFVAALEHDVGAELIASCIESLCTLLGKPSSATRPLRSLVADVRRSHIPSKPSASKQTLTGTAPLVVPKPAAVASEDRPTPVVPAPKPVDAVAKPAEVAAAKPLAIAAEKPAALIAPKPAVITAPKPAVIAAPKPAASSAPKRVTTKTITSLVPQQQTSEPTPLAAFLNAPPAAAAKVAISLPAPASDKALATPAAKPAAPEPVITVPAPAPAPAPTAAPELASFDEELDISVGSLPPPSLPVSVPPALPVAATPSLPIAATPSLPIAAATSLPAAATPSLPVTSSPTPTPLFVETQTATPAPPAASMKSSPLERARALVLSLPRNQRYAAAAAVLLCFALAAAMSVSGDTEDPIATHAAASLNQAATKPAAPPVSTPAPAASPAPRLAAAPPVPMAASAGASADDAEEPEPEDSMVDGELYDPHADPARAKANYLVNMGHRLRKQGRLGMAEASYLKALKVMPNYGRAVSGLVAVHLGRRDGVEALRWAKKLVELQPKRGAHQRLLGDAYQLAGNKAAARTAWQLGARLGDRTSRKRL